ncbi:hypothetical protein GBAR_LOCUS8522 [Geodia barretti]|uniref:Uncharacterized protein n=1 Tax=Geodia barretti TaxID=519541 RepID=A0AA35WAI9_GEOBA|nr:hypothetical protein GBAR_LOCUS8522 [Geodia barretti]
MTSLSGRETAHTAAATDCMHRVHSPPSPYSLVIRDSDLDDACQVWSCSWRVTGLHSLRLPLSPPPLSHPL